MLDGSPHSPVNRPLVVGVAPRSPVVGMPTLDEISRQSPRDRDLAAARLRSILTSAMDASRLTAMDASQLTAAASESGPTLSNVRLPSAVHPPDRRLPPPATKSMPLPWNKLPEMTTSASYPANNYSARSATSSVTNNTAISPASSAEPRLLGRLAPITSSPRPQVSYSPRLDPLHNSVPGQSNGILSTFTGAGPHKPSSMYGNMK